MFNDLSKIISAALKEDGVFDDITSDLTIPKNSNISFEIKPREDIIFCGKEVVSEVFAQLKQSNKFKNSKIEFKLFTTDGKIVKSANPIIKGFGDAKIIFAAERVILNLIQHLSGISTLVQEFVQNLNNKKIKILDTRKTLPNLRILEKYAVVMGGGKNHRFNLSDMILIKDNHIAAAGGVKKAIDAAKKSEKKLLIEVECDNVNQVKEALESKPDIIMLDNMKIPEIQKSIAIIRKKFGKKIKIEVSGGISQKNITNFSALDIDFISIGSITHSARSVDIGLDIL
jgi:nicotinate-nucleotide pyrophosphorylase